MILSIGKFEIELINKSSAEIKLDDGYLHFISPKMQVVPDVQLEIYAGIPTELLNTDLLVFESNDGAVKLWHVYKTIDGYKVVVFNPQNISEIQQVALISTSSKTWAIYVNPNPANCILPLAYPMGPLILYYLTAQFNAIMIHSSGIIDGEKGYLFSGFSGVGKSTMAGIWQSEGCNIINDDRLMLRIENKKVLMHNTPMFYQDVPKLNQLNAIFLLKQTKENCINQLHGIEAITRLMAFCIQHAYDKQYLENHLSNIFDISDSIPIFELGFKPDADIVTYIRSHV